MTQQRIIFILFFLFNSCIGSDLKNERTFEIEPVYCNKDKLDSDRIFFFENKHFIRIYESYKNSDTILNAIFGNYKITDDSILFIEPDSLQESNQFFCYCKIGFQTEKQFQLFNSMEISEDNGFNLLYKKIFDKNAPNYAVVEATKNFKGIIHGNSIELINSKEKFVIKKVSEAPEQR